MSATEVLPLSPQITPALSVAGVLLILTGFPYCFIGVKHAWLQASISTIYLVALSIAVLILHIASPPVSFAAQGAYLFGIAVPALISGAAACYFKDAFGRLSCAVGGFAISMFLLVLRPGGLLQETWQKSIFIGLWTFGSFLLSFSHYTRHYASMISVAICGATAMVLGIDCFSLAGLKEFWVYIWSKL